MDTSFLAGGPITWAALFAFAAFMVGILKAVDWIGAKLKAREAAAVSPVAIALEAAKLDIRALDEKLVTFKLEVARTYVTGDVFTRLERRIDDLVTSVREEMQETRREMLDAILGRPPRQR